MIYKNDPDTIESYLTDATGIRGNAELVYIPENYDEMKEAIVECNEKNMSISIAGAGTGLTGSRIPLSGAVISTEKLDKIISLDKEKRIAVVQPGKLITDLEDELYENNFFYPPIPTEKNSSIGGNVATNASGARTFKYGSTRCFIESLKIILADGDELILNRGENIAKGNILEFKTLSGKKYSFHLPEINMPNIKHAAGYYIKQDMDAIDLFIGSDGTLGVTKEITIKILPLPEQLLGGIIFFDNDRSLLEFVENLRTISKENNKKEYNKIDTISSRLIEYFDDNSLNLLREQYPQIPQITVAAIWFEQEYSSIHEEKIMENWMNLISKYTKFADETWIATNHKEHENLKNFRHQVPLIIKEMCETYKITKLSTDTAVPDNNFPKLFYFLKKELNELKLPCAIWGHIGDSHLHVNVLYSNDKESEAANGFYDNCINESLLLGGTVSAEHGIGKIKKKYFYQMFGREKVEKMKEIKKILDPKMLLGDGNLFD